MNWRNSVGHSLGALASRASRWLAEIGNARSGRRLVNVGLVAATALIAFSTLSGEALGAERGLTLAQQATPLVWVNTSEDDLPLFCPLQIIQNNLIEVLGQEQAEALLRDARIHLTRIQSNGILRVERRGNSTWIHKYFWRIYLCLWINRRAEGFWIEGVRGIDSFWAFHTHVAPGQPTIVREFHRTNLIGNPTGPLLLRTRFRFHGRIWPRGVVVGRGGANPTDFNVAFDDITVITGPMDDGTFMMVTNATNAAEVGAKIARIIEREQAREQGITRGGMVLDGCGPGCDIEWLDPNCDDGGCPADAAANGAFSAQEEPMAEAEASVQYASPNAIQFFCQMLDAQGMPVGTPAPAEPILDDKIAEIIEENVPQPQPPAAPTLSVVGVALLVGLFLLRSLSIASSRRR